MFPLKPRDKKPLGNWRAHQRERAPSRQIAEWANDPRPLNAAIATGAVSGVIVLDTDTDEAEAEVQRRGVPRTPTVKTAKGRHRYFRHPGFPVRNFAGKLPGLDLRGDGGYVVAAGSTHPSGFLYHWELTPDDCPFAPVPAWLLDLIKPETTAPAAPPAGSARNGKFADAALDGELAELRKAPPGRRNQTLNRCAFNLGQLVGADKLGEEEVSRHLLATALAIGLEEKEAAATIRSGLEKGKATPPPSPPTNGVQRTSRASVTDIGAARAARPLPASPPPAEPRELITTDSGGIRACLANAIIFLSGDPIEDRLPTNPWSAALAHDEFALRTVLLKPPPWEPHPPGWAPRFWEARDDLFATEWLQHHGCMVNPKITAAAVEAVAQKRRFHPVRQFLNALVWDGVPRIEDWLSDQLGAEDTPYTRAVGSRWLIAAVARIFSPGCQADNALILEGAQGQRKSSALRALGSPWFTDDLAEVTSKDAAMQTAGVWIIEIAELDALRGVEATRVKDFLSRRIDRFRPPYGERLIENPRQCVFAGSTNAVNGYLQDPTGARRFWPVRVNGECNLATLQAARAQLWAEAVHRYRSGEPWWLETPELQQAAEGETSERFEVDAWEPLIAAHIARKPDVTVGHILAECLDLPKDRWGKAETMRVGKILTALGWVRRQKRTATGREWRYEPPPVTTSPPVSPPSL